MSVTVTSPLGTSYPVLWMELATIRHAASRVVTATGGAPVAVVHGARPHARESLIALFFDDEAESAAAEGFHASGGIHTITDPDRPTHSMSYVVSGAITRTLVPETAEHWTLTLEVTEVP